MALIKKLNKVSRNSNVHGEVAADYNIIMKNGIKFLQINTYGSSDRQEKGKVSQCIQFDEETVKKLIDIIRLEFY